MKTPWKEEKSLEYFWLWGDGKARLHEGKLYFLEFIVYWNVFMDKTWLSITVTVCFAAKFTKVDARQTIAWCRCMGNLVLIIKIFKCITNFKLKWQVTGIVEAVEIKNTYLGKFLLKNSFKLHAASFFLYVCMYVCICV